MTTSAIALNTINDSISSLAKQGFKLVRNTFIGNECKGCAITALSRINGGRKIGESTLSHAARILGVTNDHIWAFALGFDGKRIMTQAPELLEWHDAGATCASSWNVA